MIAFLVSFSRGEKEERGERKERGALFNVQLED